MDRKRHIIETAQILFAQFGLKKVTVDEIARSGGVSKATIYRHFKDKADIFLSVVRAEADQLLETMAVAVASESDSEGKLRAHLRTRVGRVTDFVNFYRVTRESWGEYWPFINRIREDYLAREQEVVAGILREGVERKELQLQDPEQAARVLILALASLEFQWSLEAGDFSLPEMIDLMLEMMLGGIRRAGP